MNYSPGLREQIGKKASRILGSRGELNRKLV